jgi:hypothetical protein
MSFSAYADRFLKQKPPKKTSRSSDSSILSCANIDQKIVKKEDQNGCVSLQTKLSLLGEDLIKLDDSERRTASVNSYHLSTSYEEYILQRPGGMKLEDDLQYEDPVYEGPGCNFQCPLNNCSFKTNLEVYTY